jgi:N6-adenosine-specific RNA methylase IME4
LSTYGTIVADPPWRYGAERKHFTSAEAHYPTMTMEDLGSIQIGPLAAPDAHLYMWVTNPILTEQRIEGPTAPELARLWGFEPKSLLTWVKSENGAGMGFFFRGDTEHVIFAVRGNAPIPAALRESNVFRGRRGSHSTKPETLQDIAERVSPGPYLELFARRERLGWDTWGNESLGTAGLSGAVACNSGWRGASKPDDRG